MPSGVHRSYVTFTGFAGDIPDLYEFNTREGYYIYLHEMDCVNIQFRPISQRLDLSFECTASDIMLPPLSSTLRFEHIRICQVLDDETDSSDPAPAPLEDQIRGQVTGLAQVEVGLFSLTLLDVTVNFTSSAVECLVHP